MEETSPGKVVWHDLTVPDATTVSKFYREVVGWEIEPLSMGDYDDYVMKSGESAVGVCHARGSNNYLPPQWIIYVTVQDLDASIEKCKAHGGKIIGVKRKMGEHGTFCLIQDPAGAYMMLCGK